MKNIINRKNKGFTLIEVIVAVSIVIILSTLAVPKVSGYLSKAKEAKTISMGKQIYTAAMWSYADQGSTFIVAKVSDTIGTLANIKLSGTSPITQVDLGKSVNVDFTNDGKTYELSIDGNANNYTITDKTEGSAVVFSSTQ